MESERRSKMRKICALGLIAVFMAALLIPAQSFAAAPRGSYSGSRGGYSGGHYYGGSRYGYGGHYYGGSRYGYGGHYYGHYGHCCGYGGAIAAGILGGIATGLFIDSFFYPPVVAAPAYPPPPPPPPYDPYYDYGPGYYGDYGPPPPPPDRGYNGDYGDSQSAPPRPSPQRY
jgi:hypothetical protein